MMNLLNAGQAVGLGLGIMVAGTAVAGMPADVRGFGVLTGPPAKNFKVPADVVQVKEEKLKARGLSVRRYQQMVNGAAVLGGQLTTYSDNQGIVSVIGSHYPNLMTTNEVKLTGAHARAIAAKSRGDNGRWFTKLMIDPKNGRFFYRLENRRMDSRWFHWIDAETGAVLNAYDGLTHNDGLGVTGASRDLTGLTQKNGSSYVLKAADGRQITYDARNRSGLPGVIAADADNHWLTPGRTSPGQPALVDAHFFARVTDQYYLQTHGYNWLADYPQGMVSSAHLQRNYNNAYWNGEQMAYGDGDGATFLELSGELDVVGHELSHGVTEATSQLVYQNESGALNEAFSDIMAAAIEWNFGSGNWTIGEDITIGTNGIRNMQNPGEDGDPSHYADRYTGTADNGGVHINSGIANHWFYLLAAGGQNAKPARASGTNVVDIGVNAAEQIAFLGFTALTATATFCDARAATIAVGGAYAANVADAWDEVGVNTAVCQAGAGSGGDGIAPVISGVTAASTKGTRFAIRWMTDIPADTQVTLACCGTYTNTTLVTKHEMSFSGQKGVLYEYYVTSKDADGDVTKSGPYFFQN